MKIRIDHVTYVVRSGSPWEWNAYCAACHEHLTTGHGREGWEDALMWALGHLSLKHPRAL